MSTNKHRSHVAKKTLEFYAAAVRSKEDRDSVVLPDLLADILHHCHRNEIDFDFALDKARGHFKHEIQEEVELGIVAKIMSHFSDETKEVEQR